MLVVVAGSNPGGYHKWTRYGVVITNAYGVDCNSPNYLMEMAEQGKNPERAWILWCKAVTKGIPTCTTTKLTYPLGMWMDSPNDW